MGHYAKTLLIGCGGSGIKTLLRLNELLSSNPNYRHDVRESISYLAVDTSKGELDGFVSKIQSQMGEAGLPNIATAHITDGINGLNQIVRSTFDVYKDDPEKLEKLKQHWMFNPDGEPFRGIRIRQVEAGAGQCCQVSYLTTWNYMPKLETTLGNLVNEIRKRNSGDDNSRVQVFLVAGFAGGTGRGSWQLIAFKVRQFLEEQGITADITAVFFDASCYPNVPNSKQERENLFVNSYTAMSELAGWMRLKKALKYDFSLPYLDNPDSEVIHVYNEADPNRQSPVLQAFLIFGSNGRTGNLENNSQYHNMAATALYSMVVYPDVINAITVNRRMNIGSFGATTFEVDTYHLRSFFETAVQKKFLERQCAELTSSDLSGEVDQLLGSMNAPEKNSFLSDNCLWLPESLSASSSGISLESVEQDKNLSLLQKLYREKIYGDYVKQSKQKDAKGNELKVFSSTSRLREELLKQKDPKSGLNQWIDNELQIAALDEDTSFEALDAVLAAYELDKAHLVGKLNQTVIGLFAPEHKSVSLGRCILFATKLKECFEKYKSEVLANGVTLQGAQNPCCDIAEDVAKNLKDLVDKAYKEDNGLLGLGKKFNEKEIESICAQFQYCMYAAITLKLKPALVDFYDRAVIHLTLIEEALKNMVEILKKTNIELDKNLETDFGKLSYDEIIGEYFIDAADSNSVLKSIPAASALKNVYYRQLKPIMNREAINNLLAAEKTVRINTGPVLSEIGKQLQNLLVINDETIKNKRFDSFNEAKKVLPKELSNLIAANVHLADKVGNDTFMDAHFSFKEVLENNVKCWNKLLQESSSTQVANLKDRFRDFLGVDDDDYDEDNCLDKENILKKIILSLVASCKPWVQVVANSKLSESLDCTILLPQKIENPAELADQIKKINTHGNISMSANILCPEINGNTLNLPSDRIVVFNAEILQDNDFAPMDSLQNLTSWSKDSAVNSLLVLAEAPREGETAWFKFEDGGWNEKPTGMAYVSPIFENEPLVSLRWHPWLKETSVSMEEAQQAKAHMALFYAFLGNGLPADASVMRVLSGYNCDKPLLSIEGKEDFKFAPEYPRSRVWFENTMTLSQRLPLWSSFISTNLAMHSIDHVVLYLCGKGDVSLQSDGGNKFQQSKESGKKLCDALNAEAEVFFTNVFGTLGDADKRLLISSLYSWMEEQLSKNRQDKEYWEAIKAFVAQESEKRGVVLL